MDKSHITHLFKSWDDIPDVSHLLKIKNSYVGAFISNECPVVCVSYIVENGIVVAFGSAGYYKDENYYCENKDRQLWIEGLVSTVKGYGTLVLQELEKCLIDLSSNVKQKIIYVMSVEESVGFYENNDYSECRTSLRFRGTGNIRLAKAIGDYNIEEAKLIKYDIDDKYLPSYISTFVHQGRRRMVDKYLNIPKDIPHTKFAKYVMENQSDDLFKDNVKHLKDAIIKEVDECYDD